MVYLEEGINMTTTQVISTHRRSQIGQNTDEMIRLTKLETSAMFRVRSTATTQDTSLRLERRVRMVLLLLDGRRTIHDIARLIHRTEPEVTRSLMYLLHHGYVEYIGGLES